MRNCGRTSNALSVNRVVVNTSPLLELMAGCGSLELLRELYDEVLVPHEACEEIAAAGATGFGVGAFESAT